MSQNKPKQNIDSIRKPQVKNFKTQPKNEAPLLSILEPEATPTPIENHGLSKKNWLFRDLFGLEQTEKKKDTTKSPKTFLGLKKKLPENNLTPTKKKVLKTHHKIALGGTALGVLVFIVVLVAGGAYAHQSIYANKVYPGVMVWGEDVGGKSMTEVQQRITEKIKNYKITITGPDQNYTATANDLGLVFDSETMALSAFSKGRTGSFWNNYTMRAKLMLLRINLESIKKIIRANDLVVKPSYKVNNAKLDQYINGISANINITAKDSEIKIVNGSTELVPAIYGREVIREDLKKSLKNNISGLESVEIKIRTKQIKPNVIDNSAQEVAVQAKNVMSRPVILTYKDQTFRPNAETVGSWITFVKPNGAKSYTLVVDPNRMKNYFAFLGTKLNIYAVNKKVQIENGVKETVLREGKDGLLIDETALGKNIASTLPVQSSVNLSIPMYVAKFKTEYSRVLVANWDKYIDINLSTQTMTAYLKGGVSVGSWKVTTGNSYHPTPAGTWLVVGKSAITRMTGGTPGVDYYDLPNVHWVTWFKGGGYSIHEAYWRSSFGGMDYVWNGSHGCVNAPLAVAKFIYDWAPTGTPVIVHY